MIWLVPPTPFTGGLCRISRRLLLPVESPGSLRHILIQTFLVKQHKQQQQQPWRLRWPLSCLLTNSMLNLHKTFPALQAE